MKLVKFLICAMLISVISVSNAAETEISRKVLPARVNPSLVGIKELYLYTRPDNIESDITPLLNELWTTAHKSSKELDFYKKRTNRLVNSNLCSARNENQHRRFQG